MRARILVFAGLLVFAACVVQITGAPCTTDDNCPTGQYCIADKCSDICQNSPTCIAAGVAACDPTNTNNVGTCKDVGGDCLRLQTITACSKSGEVCDAGICACPFPSATPVEGAGCLNTGQVNCSDPGTLLTCVSDGGCKTWTATHCSTLGLSCAPDAGGTGVAACICPAWDGGSLYVDPVRGSTLGRGVFPTGLREPTTCRLRTLTNAVPLTPRNGTLVLTGWPYDAWVASAVYSINAIVRPSALNGHQYKATVAGTTGNSEPSWPLTSGATVEDGNVTWTENGTDVFILASEHFPINVPTGTTLTTTDCSAGGGSTCDSRKYILPFGGGASTGADSATAAVILDGGGLQGITILNVGANTAASAVLCGAGAPTIDHLRLYGTASPVVPPLSAGIAVLGNCAPDIHDVFAGLFSTAGIDVNTSGLVTLKNSNLGGDDGGLTGDVLGNFDGIQISNGDVTASGVLFADNIDVGVNNSALSGGTLSLSSCEVRFNGLNVDNPALSQPGISSLNGTLNMSGVTVHDNGSDGLQVFNGTANIGSTGGGTPIASNFSFNGRTTDTGSGIYAANGTVTLNGVVTNNNHASGLAVTGAIVTSTGQVANQNGLDGVTVYNLGSGSAVLSNATLTNNMANGLSSAGRATLVNSATVTGNGASGIYAASTVIVDGGTLNSMVISGNGRDGLTLLAGAWVLNADISNNVVDAGIYINSTAPISILNSHIHLNGSGVNLVRTAPAAGPVAGGVFSGDLIFSNNGVGIGAQNLCSSACPITNASVTLCTINDNADFGIVSNPGPGNYSAVTFQQIVGNDIYNNARANASNPAGVLIGTNTTLSKFQSNTVHNNKGPQLWFSNTLDILQDISGSCSAPNTANSFFGYSTTCGANLGLRSDIVLGTNANGNYWVHDPPGSGTDYMGNLSVTVSGPCGAITGTCQ